ncbi:MAG: T9SS type A sorting domain-containing protein, partial [Flavobacteriales bacterium]|nr:T9SS type A sorting domain-containing protein [Flavobacteriales bacterium]
IITTFDLNYSVDNGSTVTQNVTGVSIAPFSVYNFAHATAWNVNTLASYSLKVWVENVNGGGVDAVLSNDDKTKTVTTIDAIPNIIPSYTSDTITLTYEMIGDISDQVNKPQDLDFSPDGDLWVVNRGLGGDVGSGGGTTVKFTNPGATGQNSEYKKDQNSKHFMNEPTAIAFSFNGNFSTSPGMYDANFSGGNSPFTGPALWSSDPLVYAQPSGGNGSHLDMLHASSYSMGIAHEDANVFWVFDGNNNDIVRYDFTDDHGPGNSFHDDGKIRRYTGMSVSRIDNFIGSHMELQKRKGWLYIVDNGNQRVIRLNVHSGTLGGKPSYGPFETLEEYKNVDGATWEVVVDAGLVEPSGIDVIGDYMIVTDHSNGDIIFYDISTIPATEIKRVATGNPGIMGTVIGPEGMVWFVNYSDNEVYKIVPSSTIVAPPPTEVEEINIQKEFSLYPNPSTGLVSLKISQDASSLALITVVNILGETVLEAKASVGQVNLNLARFAPGIYMVNLEDKGVKTSKRLIIQK